MMETYQNKLKTNSITTPFNTKYLFVRDIRKTIGISSMLIYPTQTVTLYCDKDKEGDIMDLSEEALDTENDNAKFIDI